MLGSNMYKAKSSSSQNALTRLSSWKSFYASLQGALNNRVITEEKRWEEQRRPTSKEMTEYIIKYMFFKKQVWEVIIIMMYIGGQRLCSWKKVWSNVWIVRRGVDESWHLSRAIFWIFRRQNLKCVVTLNNLPYSCSPYPSLLISKLQQTYVTEQHEEVVPEGENDTSQAERQEELRGLLTGWKEDLQWCNMEKQGELMTDAWKIKRNYVDEKEKVCLQTCVPK